MAKTGVEINESRLCSGNGLPRSYSDEIYCLSQIQYGRGQNCSWRKFKGAKIQKTAQMGHILMQ